MSRTRSERSAARGSVVVTGASTGIGAEICTALVAEHFRVYGTVRRAEDGVRLERAAVVPLFMDVTDLSSIAAARAAVQENLGHGRLAGLVNNAGIPLAGPLELVSLDRVRHLFDVNVFGLLAVTQAFLPLLRRGAGRIINMSSVSGRIALPFIGPYAASKFAVEALSDSLRRELVPAGIPVTVVEPGSIHTPIWDKVARLDLDYTAGTPYAAIVDWIRAGAVRRGMRGLPAAAVAAAVVRALLAPNPPIRVPVVRSRLRWHLRRLLPDRVLDRLVARRVWPESGSSSAGG